MHAWSVRTGSLPDPHGTTADSASLSLTYHHLTPQFHTIAQSAPPFLEIASTQRSRWFGLQTIVLEADDDEHRDRLRLPWVADDNSSLNPLNPPHCDEAKKSSTLTKPKSPPPFLIKLEGENRGTGSPVLLSLLALLAAVATAGMSRSNGRG
jgi:hypothetical protein